MEHWAPAPCTPTPHAAAPALLSSAQFRKVCFCYCMRHQTEEGRNYTTFLPNRRNPLGGQQLRSPLGVGRVGMSRSQGQKATMCIQRALRSRSPLLSFNFLVILQSLLELQTEAPGPVWKAFCRLGRTRGRLVPGPLTAVQGDLHPLPERAPLCCCHKDVLAARAAPQQRGSADAFQAAGKLGPVA